MKVLHYTIKRQTVRINVAETPWDLDKFIDFVEANPTMGFDTETTGLNWWDSDRGFRIRLAQFGNGVESWVLPVETNPQFNRGHMGAPDRPKADRPQRDVRPARQ
ncbi:hypothetical protein ACR6C2_16620 [Streptomyces sp. INA 01156]